MFIKEVKLYFQLCNLLLSNGQQTNLYQLDMLHHPRAPCDVHEIRLNVFDMTDSCKKISRGNGHTYLTFLLHKECTLITSLFVHMQLASDSEADFPRLDP
jgi:hypothetical protein